MGPLAMNIIIAHNIENVLDKLILAKDIYSKTSSRVHFDPMKELFNDLRQHKKLMLTELANVTEIELDDISLSIQDKITVELEKIGIELDHLLIENNYNETLSFCVKRERELLEAYDQALEGNRDHLDEAVVRLLEQQRMQTSQLLERLEKRHSAGDFKNW